MENGDWLRAAADAKPSKKRWRLGACPLFPRPTQERRQSQTRPKWSTAKPRLAETPARRQRAVYRGKPRKWQSQAIGCQLQQIPRQNKTTIVSRPSSESPVRQARTRDCGRQGCFDRLSLLLHGVGSAWLRNPIKSLTITPAPVSGPAVCGPTPDGLSAKQWHTVSNRPLLVR